MVDSRYVVILSVEGLYIFCFPLGGRLYITLINLMLIVVFLNCHHMLPFILVDFARGSATLAAILIGLPLIKTILNLLWVGFVGCDTYLDG